MIVLPKILDVPVTLEQNPDASEADNALVINGGDHLFTFDALGKEHHGGHAIRLTLQGNADAGRFCALSDPDNPGITWLLRTPKCITATLSEDAKSLMLSNRHYGPADRGRWYYQLFARFGDRLYGVPLTFAAGPARSQNPSIKNR